MHEAGRDFFPYTGFVKELGTGDGYGYAVNIPLAPHSDDLIFEQALQRVILPLVHAFSPDILVTQMGMDILRADPLTRLEMTTGAVESAARTFLNLGLPWVALGGGGYDKLNAARGWTLLWAVMSGQSVEECLPEPTCTLLKAMGFKHCFLRDRPHLAQPDDFCRAQEQLDRTVAFLKRRLFPLHGINI
jgi:acetoin utilization protein AcuC